MDHYLVYKLFARILIRMSLRCKNLKRPCVFYSPLACLVFNGLFLLTTFPNQFVINKSNNVVYFYFLNT